MKKVICLVLTIVMLIPMGGCTLLGPDVDPNIDPKEWNMLLESSKGSTVVLYTDLQSELALKWLTTEFKTGLKDAYGIDVDIRQKTYQELVEKLMAEKQEEIKVGNVDLFLFNRSYVPALKRDKLIYGPFVDKINNYHMYQDKEDLEIVYTNGEKSDGYAALVGRDQLILQYDEDKLDEAPDSLDALKSVLVSKNMTFTYIDPSIKTGRDFITSVFASTIGYEKLLKIKTKEELKSKSQKAIAWLNSLEPHMYAGGKQFPRSQKELDDLFKTGQVNFGMTETLNHTSLGARDDSIAAGAKAFVPKSGTTGNAYYMVIPFNSPNKAGAMLTIDYMLSPEAQGGKYHVKKWGNLPAIDTMKLDKETAKIARKNMLKRNDIKEEDLLARRIPEIPDTLSNMIYQVWMEEVKLK